MADPHAELAKFDQAIAEHEARQLADEIGYTFGVLTDGTIVLEPPADPHCCGTCAADAAARALLALIGLGPATTFPFPTDEYQRALSFVIAVCTLARCQR